MTTRDSLTSIMTKKYIDKHLESSKKINYTELNEKHGVVKVFYKDLPNKEMEGYPVASDYVGPDGQEYSVDEYVKLDKELQKKCELRFYYLPYSHELYVGTTGSGKTTGCVEPQLRAISCQKNKPDLFLTDPKGELFDRNAKHLQKQGYKIMVLNFKDLLRSDRWNPLLEVYEKKMLLVNDIGKGYRTRYGAIPKTLIKMADDDQFKNGAYVEYKGKAFPTHDALKEYNQFEKDYIEAEIDDIVNQTVNMMIKVQSTKDPTWEYGAQDLLKGIIHCMLEDAVKISSGMNADKMNFRNLHQYYLALRGEAISDSGRYSLRDHWLLEDKSDKPIALMSTALENAPNTMRSYCGVFDTAVKDWFQGHIFSLTTGNTIDFKQIGDQPFAVFLITRDYEKSDFMIAGLFIDWVYRQMIQRAEKTKNPRPFHFLLDEFGNIPEIKDLENKISTSRSRNIWFHLVVQSYRQIDLVYGEERSQIIRDNCNAQIFLGAQNRKTKEIFSEECGMHSIPPLSQKLNNINNGNPIEVRLIPVSALDLITPGQMYVKRLYMPVITSQFIRSYMCAEQGAFADFIDADGLQTCTPIAVEAYTAPKYTYAALKKPKKNNKWDF